MRAATPGIAPIGMCFRPPLLKSKPGMLSQVLTDAVPVAQALPSCPHVQAATSLART